ncbi:hypothetical protein AYL99_11710 [Fonsecaea erecta]|uniref:Uncharacterized protein n=1 Tax=Fonsecaea erecta TaxID=1367422 RepID=A0A178Z520_9EURO|nr:hypothetical protein AYL99_11710 [Fonsecaea erecta]OAP54175.1 hypothetical protein AYL99_11710 [Fonsecaea erecta]
MAYLRGTRGYLWRPPRPPGRLLPPLLDGHQCKLQGHRVSSHQQSRRCEEGSCTFKHYPDHSVDFFYHTNEAPHLLKKSRYWRADKKRLSTMPASPPSRREGSRDRSSSGGIEEVYEVTLDRAASSSLSIACCGHRGPRTARMKEQQYMDDDAASMIAEVKSVDKVTPKLQYFFGGNSTMATCSTHGALTPTQVDSGIQDSVKQFYEDTLKSARDRRVGITRLHAEDCFHGRKEVESHQT